MNGSPVAPPDPSGNDEEVVLRLGDLLRRIPEQHLNEGPHDRMRPIRLSVDALASQISRGAVTIPLASLAAVCPEIFKAPKELPADEEVALPLQRLLDQIGLVANPSPVHNPMPKAQLEQARETAARILAEAEAGKEQAGPFAIAKAFSAARSFFGRFGRSTETARPATAPEEAAKPEVLAAEPPSSEPAPPAVEGFISLRIQPILQLLPREAVEPGFDVPAEARVVLPLALIDSQLASGHVEVPLAELAKALPEELRGALRPAEGVQAWIPLNEIFQGLPETHPFFMPPLEPGPECPPQAEAPAPPPEETPPEKATEPAPPPPPEETAPPAAEEGPARAPWMRGFIVPPPQLLASGETPQPAPAPAAEVPPAKTPEARQTADFLASQPGIFAAAAFVEGAIFASADFPRKPDPETLRDVVGAFVESARESARRLGWNGLLTLACEDFFVTAVIRPSHFVTALHHDRVLSPASHEALLRAAEDLGKPAGNA